MEQIISASGTQYGLIINSDGTIGITGTVDINNIAGSIIIGSVSANVDSIYVQSGDNINITGMPKTEVYGSGTFNVIAGSEQWIKNWNEIGSSRAITNFGDLGSSRIVTNLYAGSSVWQGERWGVSGNVTIENSSLATTLGSTNIWNRVAGSIVNLPSVNINNPTTIGSYTTQNILGSVAISTTVLPISGVVTANTGLYAGSKFYQGEKYEVSGIVEISNLYAGSKNWIIDTTPTNSDRNNEAWKFEYDALNNLGSITQYIGAGSYVSVFTWAGYSGTIIGIGSRITNIGSYF